MSDFTSVVNQIESGDPSAAELLLPLVYNELRNLAAARLSREKPGHLLQATGLVHEAYLRLVSASEPQHWESRGHFFAAAAEAMRRILIEKARSKRDANTATNQPRSVWDGIGFDGLPDKLDVLALNDAILKLEAEYPKTGTGSQIAVFRGPDT